VIRLNNVHKRYWTQRGDPHWVLRGITLAFPQDQNTGVIGVNGAGKSTMLQLIAGTDMPTRGEVRADGRISWPIGLTNGLQRTMTGRQNARFICRIHGLEDDMNERLEFVRDFSELGAAFDEPVRTYSSGMRARLSFSLSLAFDFDMYLVDEVMAVGDAAFQAKSRLAMKDLAKRAGMIIVSHSERTIKSFCDSAVLLHEGLAYRFDSADDAIKEYQKVQNLKEATVDD
jgi:capsular polysaccharide transport system ATP-binding protein